jgi:hypothetical protein
MAARILQGGTRLLWCPGDKLRFLSKLRSNKTTDNQQPDLRSLSEFYKIIFLNKLKIVENTKNI